MEFPEKELVWEEAIRALGAAVAGGLHCRDGCSYMALLLFTTRPCCRPQREVGCAGSWWAQQADAAGSTDGAVTVAVSCTAGSGRGSRGGVISGAGARVAV